MTKPKGSGRNELINKDHSRNKWIKSKKDTKDQQIQELVLWKDKQDWETLTNSSRKKDRGPK